MSLFLAVRPDVAAAEHLADALDPVRRLPGCSALRWQPAGLWHVTLAFFGPAAAVLDDVVERLAPLADRPAPPAVHLVGSGHFGRQVLWTGIGDAAAVARLGEVGAAAWPLLRGSGVGGDRRPWRPHMTLARARVGDVRVASAALSAYVGPSWRVDQVLLLSSTGGPHPQHEIVAEYALSGSAPGHQR